MIPGVPYDEELEYIESTGTQYIDTGIAPDDSMSVSIKMEPLEAYSQYSNCFCGAGNATSYPHYDINARNGYITLWNGGAWAQSDVVVEQGKVYDIHINASGVNSTIVINGISKSFFAHSGLYYAYPFYIFTLDYNNAPHQDRFVKMRLYSFYITKGDVKIIDLIPVRVNGVAMMYDRVNRKFPAHYGTFVAGPVVARPVMGLHFYPRVYTARDYIQNGLVAIWDGVANAGWGVHDASADNWTELVSGKVTPTVSKGTFSDSAFKIATANSLNLVSNNFGTQTARTVEISFSDRYGSRANRVYIEDNNNNSGFSLQSNTANCRLTCNLGNSHQQEVPYSEIAQADSISCHWALAQSSTATVYTNGMAKNTANKPMPSFTSIGLGLRTNIQADYYCIRVYSRALTASEIAHNYNIDKWRFNLT